MKKYLLSAICILMIGTVSVQAQKKQVTQYIIDGSLFYVDVKLTDKKGNFAPTACNDLKFSIKGPGEILAVDAGDPTCLTPFHSDSIKAFNGLASVIVKVKPGARGRIVVTATSDGLKRGRTRIKL